MNRTALLALLFTGLAAGCATPPEALQAPRPGPDGLAVVPSGRVDQLYMRPGGEIASYRKVVLEPVAVELNSDWMKQRHGSNYRIQPTYPRYKDTDEVIRETAAAVSTSLAKAFRASGFQIVEAPGADVMRVSAKVTDLFINAPDIVSPGYTKNATRDAGDAYLALDARDSLNGKPLVKVQHHAIARETPRGNVANDPSNTLWMETLFQRWADNCATEIALAQRDAHASLK
ncbi:MAG TPA: DUF3313 family protein [Burkholderiales bacterium]|jgi:hypothetical protein|nr:DUF3313 family protein [Burkholderiales bacterium]